MFSTLFVIFTENIIENGQIKRPLNLSLRSLFTEKMFIKVYTKFWKFYKENILINKKI